MPLSEPLKDEFLEMIRIIPGKDVKYPLVMTNIAMENGPFIDDLATKRLIFHSYVNVYQRVKQLWVSMNWSEIEIE